ncbi:MAG: DinB family protein [Vicinamibacteria bacterium]|nr:DinB family protein [Vicinamibacteria bacterium]
MEPEAWLRGPQPGVDPLLMPAAHAFVQVGEEVARLCAAHTADDLARQPGTAATAAFHLRHIAGATDRLLTYARGETLTAAQVQALRTEKDDATSDPALLGAEVARVLDAALAQLRATPRETLLEPRSVGRAGLPSTVIGLVFHAAEHAQRHAGQLATTLRAI